jgi:hypothetical protein
MIYSHRHDAFLKMMRKFGAIIQWYLLRRCINHEVVLARVVLCAFLKSKTSSRLEHYSESLAKWALSVSVSLNLSCAGITHTWCKMQLVSA